jgi:hypothetical protein
MTRQFMFGLSAALVLTAASASVSQATPCSLTSLGWMAGSWHNATEPGRAGKVGYCP